ncbi:hypothetical protein GCM10022276_10440 [Sphingomonas limnosediminicola]|uniref:Class I SAM-dependent methyltransferase n=1 Tax=Sphingomonas limnosediminicola TaxID=940133 RepID=A0ABP7L625_9SPHN
MDVASTVKIVGPFGPATKVEELNVRVLEDMYRAKCGVDIDLRARGIDKIDLFRCDQTGVRFWRPVDAAGDEEFYKTLSGAWAAYYREWRWEYGKALALTSPTDRLLEIGCGRGYFLRLTEGRVAAAAGLELNRDAIANKVTRWPVHRKMSEELAASEPESFDYVCSYQVLEHVIDPASFIRASLSCLKPGGLLVYSTPNTEYGPNKRREDAFDFPPHHMSYFTHASYRRIAALHGLKIVTISDAPTFGALRNPTDLDPFSRQALMEWVRNTIDRMRRRTGMTTFVAMRKPLEVVR